MFGLREIKGMKENGITLVALVITIVILLILAGISILTLTNTGIFQKAKEAKQKSEEAEKNEEQILGEYQKESNKYISKDLESNIGEILNETTELHDKNGGKIVVPAGYKVVVNEDTNNALTIEEGIVIEDEKKNQYVWIPCTTEESNTQLKYKRTEWDIEDDFGTKASKDELTLSDSKCSDDDKKNGLTDEVVADIIAQIKKEKESVKKNGGYYIGRYETGNEGDVAVIKYNQMPYINITWSKAYNLAMGIGGGTAATTYLCSSYAWDTAINFIQNNGYSNYAKIRDDKYNENWSDKIVRYDEVTKPVGTLQRLLTGKTTPKCNIYDMGGNVAEFTTEVNPNINDTIDIEPIMFRGGAYNYNSPAGNRGDGHVNDANDNCGFRVTLFLK